MIIIIIIVIIIIVIIVFVDGTVTSSGTGNNAGSVSNSGSGTASSGGSSRLGVREMMQRAVTAARSASSSLAGLEVEEDAPIPTLHWRPEGPGDLKRSFNSLQ